ncbi:MAG: tetratricopeptide repeat protein, partial [Rubripirellula sp.]
MMDRFHRVSARMLVGITVAAMTAGTGSTVLAAPPSAKAALSLKPVQTGVDYEIVPDSVLQDCKVVDINRDGWTGWEVTAPDGSLLRRFADTNGDKKVDLWCYFKFGVEVYRDIDEDYNGKADQYRWLATGGMRWGLDEDEDGRVDRWKQISAEEVTSEVVAALRDADAARFARLLISGSELKSLGLGKAKLQQITEKADRAARGFSVLAKEQSSIGPDARWVQFAASSPGVVPSGTEGSSEDVVVYENAVAMFEQGDESGQLMVGTLIKVDDAWRLVELPSVGEEGTSVAQSTGNFFTPGGASAGGTMANSNLAQETQDLVTALEKIDGDLASATDSTDVATLHDRRADVVEELIAGSGNAADRDTWVRQLVDMLSVGAQTGSYPEGVKRLRSVAGKFAGNDENLKAYADYQAISTEYVVRQTPDADFAKVQEWYLDSLSGFVERYPRTPEAAQAWLQLALSKEFEDKEKEALVFYKKVASAFPSTDAGEKAAGAVRRLESVGQQVD